MYISRKGQPLFDYHYIISRDL